jgi:uncharacterized protein
MIRERLSGDLKTAVTIDDADRIATLRLICAAVKDKDLAAQQSDNIQGVSDEEVLAILIKMLKQREASIADYEQSGRLDLADQERNEMNIIREYLPRPLSDKEVSQAIARAIEQTGAKSVRDINRVMAHLKARHAGRMDFSHACSELKNCFR